MEKNLNCSITHYLNYLIGKQFMKSAGYSDGKFTLWIVPSENKKQKKHNFKSVGFHHFAIRVETKKDVDKAHNWCKKQKIMIIDSPSKYPEYSKNYYATFFLDPDGMKIEIVYT
ncbi:VOC family protein [Candidatus Woesearchaeota archaeon]|nr:VOC family protein [Candidatus Woesearchaeota archaeon]